MTKRRAPDSALDDLVKSVDSLISNFAIHSDVGRINEVLAPMVNEVLGSVDDASPLLAVLQQFGWRLDRFATPGIDLSLLSNQLKRHTWRSVSELGSGAYASVWIAKNIFTSEVVVMKKQRVDPMDLGVPATVLREVSLLRELQHPNVVK
jgi:hypothetical protein